jgi:hypothetical protein
MKVLKMVKKKYCELEIGLVIEVGLKGELEEQCDVDVGDRDDDDENEDDDKNKKI